jgi:Domain of unknown function (DUF4430)
MNENTYKLISVALLCTTIAASAFAVYNNFQFNELEKDYAAVLSELEDFTAQVDLMIDYGNGTVTWYNDTRIQSGSSVLDATVVVCGAEYQTSDFGAFITSVNGVQPDSSHFWMWSTYEDGWEVGMVGADQYNIHDGDIIRWTYTSITEW